MKSLIALLITISWSTSFARDTTLQDVSSILPIENGWTTTMYAHGQAANSGLGIGLETPTWHSLGVRLTYSFDSLDNNAVSFTYNTLQAALKLQLVRGTSNGIIPYFLIASNMFTPVKSSQDTGGSKSGTEYAFGAEWRHNQMSIINDNTTLGAVFIELGRAGSTFSTAITGGIVVHNGAIARLGYRVFF